MLRVLEINEAHDLSHIRANWQRLWESTETATFFHTLAWLQIYWKHFGNDKTLRVILVLENDRLIGVVPLVVVNEATRLGTLRVLTYPLSDWGSYFSLLSGQPRKVLRRALQYVQETKRDWDFIDLRWLDENDLEKSITAGAMNDAGYAASTGIWKQTTLVEFDGNWEDYLRTRSPKLRADIRRKLKKFDRTGRVHLERYRPKGSVQNDGDPNWDLFQTVTQIAEQSWQGSSTSGTTISHRDIRNYIRDCHVAAAELGMLDMAVLHFEQQPIGFCYNYIARGRIFGLRRGDAPAAREHGLGTVLTSMMLRDSFERGDKCLDMGPESFQAKRRWMTRIATIGRVTHYPLWAPKAQLLRLKHWWETKRDKTNELSVSHSAAD